MPLFYDVFDPEEEEEFWESERDRCRRCIREFISSISEGGTIASHGLHASELVIDVGLSMEELFLLTLALRQQKHKLRRLSISNWQEMGDIGSLEIARLLLTDDSIDSLSLKTCGITSVGANELIRSIHQASDSPVRYLDLSGNSLLFPLKSFGKHQASLGDSFARNVCESLDEINLAFTGLDETSVRCLLEAACITQNNRIRVIDVSGNFHDEALGSLILVVAKEYLPRISPRLEKLIMTNGGTATCLDLKPNILQHLHKALQQHNNYSKLYDIGPLDLPEVGCPEDQKHSSKYLVHLRCHRLLRQVNFQLTKNQINTQRLLQIDALGVWPQILQRMNSMADPQSLLFYLVRAKIPCFLN